MAISLIWVAEEGMADIGARRLRHAGAGPMSAKDIAPPGRPAAAPASVAHCTTTSSGSKRPAAETTSSGALAPSDSRGGNRYHAERRTAGCWTPDRQLPITGVLAGSRP